MKKYILILSITIFNLNFAQVLIGSGKTGVSNASVSLEFGTEKKGMVLPYAKAADVDAATDENNTPTAPVNGTLVFDPSDRKVKMKNASGWFDYTNDATGTVNTSGQDSLSELKKAKVSIGTPTSTPGLLVLEDHNKAMVLPTVTKYSDIVNPAPGMMVYDLTAKQLCFYNGTVWSFWKAN